MDWYVRSKREIRSLDLSNLFLYCYLTKALCFIKEISETKGNAIYEYWKHDYEFANNEKKCVYV